MFNLNVCIIRANPYLNGSYTESTARIGYTLQTFLLVICKQKMKNTAIIESKTNMSMIWLLSIGGVLMMVLGLYLLLLQNNSGKHDDGWILRILGTPFLILGLYAVYALLNHDHLTISKRTLIIESIFGKTKNEIDLSKVNSYTEISKQNMKFRHELAHMKWKDLTLICDGNSYQISSSTYRNYDELRKHLTKGIKQNKTLENEWQRKNNLKFGYGFTFFGPLLALLIFRNGIPSDQIVGGVTLIGFLMIPTIVGVNLIRKNKKSTDNTV